MQTETISKGKSTRRNEADVIDLLEIAQALWHRAWIILIVTLLIAAGAVAYAVYLVTPMYSSSVMMYVNNKNSSNSSNYISTTELAAAQSLVDTYLVILNTQGTLQEVCDESGLDYSFNQLKSMISSSAVNSTEVFQITVTAPSAEDAYVLVNTIAKVLPEKIANVVDGSSVRVVEKGTLNNTKVSPSYRRYALYGALIGLVLSCGLITIRTMLDDTVKDENDVIEILNTPLLASIPELDEKGKKGYGYYDYGYKSKEAKK